MRPNPAWLAAAQEERKQVRLATEKACAELQWRAQHDPAGVPMLAMQVQAMEAYSNALGYRIAAAEIQLAKEG